MSDYREVRTTEHEQGREQRVTTFKVTQLIWLLLGILEALIALRVVFKLIGVNEANTFAVLLYNVTGIFVAPFASLIGAPAAGGMVLEISSILAMFIYLLIGWALAKVVNVLFYRPRGPVSTNQTTIAEHTPQQAPLGVSQTTTTTQTPTGSSQTTTERTNTSNDLR
ncbi:MAG TPA: YggT family protein [Longilinea sp.]|nr:YggT family protein [Longilinea sp.]